MTGPGRVIAAEQFLAVPQAQAPFADEQFIGAVAIDIDDRRDMAAQCAAGLGGVKCGLPERLQPGAVSVKSHRSVGALEGDHDRLALDLTPDDEVAIDMRERGNFLGFGPRCLTQRAAGGRVDLFQHVLAEIQGMRRIAIPDNVDLIHAVLVQVGGEDRAEPDSGHHAGTEIPLPVNAPSHVEEDQFQRALGEEEHADVGIDLGIGRIERRYGFGLTKTEFDGHRTQLRDRLAKVDFGEDGQVDRGRLRGVYSQAQQGDQQHNAAQDLGAESRWRRPRTAGGESAGVD